MVFNSTLFNLTLYLTFLEEPVGTNIHGKKTKLALVVWYLFLRPRQDTSTARS